MDEKLPEKKIIFKVRDKTGEGKKGTHKKTGSVCGNDGMKKEQIVDFLNKIKPDNNYKDLSKTHLPGKQLLCLEVEIYLRINDINKTNIKMVFNGKVEIKINQ